MTGPRLVHVACNLCGQDRTEPVYEAQGLKVVRCLSCGLNYVNPRLSSAELQKLYTEDFYTSDASPAGCDCSTEHSEWYDRTRFQADLKQIHAFIKPPGRLLDVGCGLGRFLEMARDAGWDGRGVEFSEYGAREARRKGFEVKTGPLRHADFPARSFDLVTLFHSLEHMEDPLRLLRDEVRPLLRTGGFLLIEVPNFGCESSRTLKGDWVWSRPKEHLYGFTPDSLSKLAAAAGFKVAQCMTKSVHTLDGIQDVGQIGAYARLSNASWTRGLKDRLRRTPLWSAVKAGRAALFRAARLFYKPPLGEAEILLIAERDT